jgi:hypothetical protein
MRVVEIQVNAARDGEKAGGTVKLERRQSDGLWKAEKEWKVESDEPGAYRKIFVEEDQRVVVEGRSNTRLEYDREQACVREVPVGPADEAEEKSAKGGESEDSDGDEEVLKKPFRPQAGAGVAQSGQAIFGTQGRVSSPQGKK